jgi:hypothetical protein
MNVTRSLLDGIKTKQLQWYGHVQRMEEGRLPKEVMKWRPPGGRKRGRPKLTWADGIRRLMGEKGFGGGRLERQTQLEEEDIIINKWAQENVNTLCSLMNNNGSQEHCGYLGEERTVLYIMGTEHEFWVLESVAY